MAELVGYRQLQARLHAIGGAQMGRPVLQKLGLSAVREQKLLVRRKTDNTGRSIHMEGLTDTSVRTVAGGAAVVLEGGTRAHEITPKARKALRWAAANQRRLSGRARSGATDFTFATRVHHPGTHPYPFMLPGARKAVESSKLAEVIVSLWNSAA